MGLPAPPRARIRRNRASRPRLPDSLKPTPTLSRESLRSTTANHIAEFLSANELRDRRKIDELQANLRAHAEHKLRVFDYLLAVKASKQEAEEGGGFEINPEDVADNEIAGHMLSILNTLDVMIAGADQRLIEAGSKLKRPVKGLLTQLEVAPVESVIEERNKIDASVIERPSTPVEEVCIKSAHDDDAGRVQYTLPAWNNVQDKQTAPRIPFQSLSQTAPETVHMPKVQDSVQANDSSPERTDLQIAPAVIDPMAVEHMSEQLLSPQLALEDLNTTLRRNGELENNKHEATLTLDDGEVAQQHAFEGVKSPLPSQDYWNGQTQEEAAINMAIAAIPPVRPSQKNALSNSPRRRKLSDAILEKATPPLATLEEEEEIYSLSDYEEDPDPTEEPQQWPSLDSDHLLAKTQTANSDKSSDSTTSGDTLVEPSGSSDITGSKTYEDSRSSLPTLEEGQTTDAATMTAEAKVAALLPKSYQTDFKVTGGTGNPYKPSGRLAELAAARKAGVILNAKQSIKDLHERMVQDNVAGTPTASGPLRNPFLTPNKGDSANPFSPDDDASVYSCASGWDSQDKTREKDFMADDPEKSITGSPLRRTSNVKGRKTNVPSSAVGRYLAGPEATREDILQMTPPGGSKTSRSPKELRMLGLTMEDLFIDPDTGAFKEPDKTMGGVAELRRKYAVEAREMWNKGELSLKSKSSSEEASPKLEPSKPSKISESARRMPPPSRLPMLGGTPRRDTLHRQHSTPASLAAGLFSMSRKNSGPVAFKAPRKRAPTPIGRRDEGESDVLRLDKKSSSIGAGMRRIFAGSFGAKTSASIHSTSTAGSGEGRPPSRVSFSSTVSMDGMTRTSASIHTTGSAASSTRMSSDTGDSMTRPLISADTTKPMSILPRKLPSPPPRAQLPPPALTRHHTVPQTTSATSSPRVKEAQLPKTTTETPRTKKGMNIPSFPTPPNKEWGTPDHPHPGALVRSSSDPPSSSTTVPAIILTPPFTKPGPNQSTSTSRVPVPVRTIPIPISLKRPQSGAGSRPGPAPAPKHAGSSRPTSRADSRAGATSRSPGSRSGRRRNSPSSSRPSSARSKSRSASRSKSRLQVQGAQAQATTRPISRARGVANLKMLEYKHKQLAPPPKMGALLLPGHGDEGGRPGSRAGGSGGGLTFPPPVLRPGSRATGERAHSRLGADSNSGKRATGTGTGTGTVKQPDEWNQRDIPRGPRLPPPHAMNSPGGRYPKPVSMIVGGGRKAGVGSSAGGGN